MSLGREIRDWMVDRQRSWAVITGASSGIGKALAFEFAGGGFNILLVARNREALAKVAEECRSKHGIETEVIASDLSCAESLHDLINALTDNTRHYEILVNNAGFG